MPGAGGRMKSVRVAQARVSRPPAPGIRPLLAAAIAARAHAFAPYSKFQVGAAIEDAEGRIHTGCNVENATYGLTLCAERVAVFKAISEGVRKFRRVAVAADTDVLTPPCGACRQILWEFCGDVEIALVNLHGKTETYRLKDLFPKPFDGSYL
jgi:cytidine deaminase